MKHETQNRKIKIAFCGGGTGGHLFPLIAVARELKRLHSHDDLKLYYFGPKDEFGRILLLQENFKIKNIAAAKIRRYFSFQNISDMIFKLPLGFIQSFFLLLFIRPRLVFSKGGPGAVPVCFCAKLLVMPVFLHESDIIPGLSNRVTSGWAKKTFISFDKTEYFDLSKTILTGHPILKELLEGNRQSAKETFNLSLEKPVILFVGGSQGAGPLNDFVALILNDILKKYEIIHSCGKNNYREARIAAEMTVDENLKKYYHLCEFLNEVELKHVYAAADLIISRAGAGSVFEIAALGKPSILIPLPTSAANHQAKNAYYYAQTGAALIIEQENLTPNFFIEKINQLFSRPDMMKKMKEAALKFAKPLAAKAIAREILEYLDK